MLHDYDIETYPTHFTFWATNDDGTWWYFEISKYRDDYDAFMEFMLYLYNTQQPMVGYNNIGFDYPVIHFILTASYRVTYQDIYAEAMRIISTPWDDRFKNRIYEPLIPQVDLFLIKHFDNAAKSTRLKSLEFAMRMNTIEDLPYPPGTELNEQQGYELAMYNKHDVQATHDFRKYVEKEGDFGLREELSAFYAIDMTNFNDTKIGAKIFEYELNKQGIGGGQTFRSTIALADCISDKVMFYSPKLKRIHLWLNNQVISETKGVFTDLTAKVDGFEFVFGTGGLHGSIKPTVVTADDDYDIIDVDVKSYYPNLSIKNNWFPEHLTEYFCHVYQLLYERRGEYPKETHPSLNKAIKLALNGTYGNSNSKYSIFYDPKFTMRITLNGQLFLCMLAERLMLIPTVKMIQANTDGVTVKIRKDYRFLLDEICQWWEAYTDLELESVDYSAMYIRDVNNYIAVGIDGKRKLKGAYEGYSPTSDSKYGVKDWHKDLSALVIPRVAERVLVDNDDLESCVREWPNKFDFVLQGKTPRNSHLEIDGIKQQSVMRYYVSKTGGEMTKIMPPLKGKFEPRVFAQEKGWLVKECNDIERFDWNDLDFDYYVEETRKLVDPVLERRL